MLALHKKILHRNNEALLQFCQRYEIKTKKLWDVQGNVIIKPSFSCWGFRKFTSKRKARCVVCQQEIPANEERVDLYLKPWNDEEWVEEFCYEMEKKYFCCHEECVSVIELSNN